MENKNAKSRITSEYFELQTYIDSASGLRIYSENTEAPKRDVPASRMYVVAFQHALDTDCTAHCSEGKAGLL